MSLRVGVIGAGYFGKHYIRLLQAMEGAELAGVAAHLVADLANVPEAVKHYASANELLSDNAIDAVVIATPPSTHMALTITALESGKHVLLEKPMAVTLAEAGLIADMVKKTGRVFMIGHQYCYNDHIRALKREIEDKTLGDIKYIFAEHMYTGPVRLDIGCLWETATHELAMMDFLFPKAQVKKITGYMVDMMGSGRDDMTTAALVYDNGMTVTLFTTWFAPQKVRRMIIGGTKGMALFDESQSSPLVITKHPYPSQELPEEHTSHFFEITKEEVYIPDIVVGEPLHNQLSHFIACVRDHKTPVTDAAHALRVTQLLDKITIQISE